MYLLLSCIVERITGSTFEQALRDLILNPLAMDDTDFTSNYNNWDWKKFASPHSYDKLEKKTKRIQRLSIETVSPGEGSGGVFSSATDMANWMLMNLNKGDFNGKRIINESSIMEIHSPQFATSTFQMMIVSFFCLLILTTDFN